MLQSENVLLEIGFGLALKLKSSSRNRNDDKLIFGKSYSIPIGLLVIISVYE